MDQDRNSFEDMAQERPRGRLRLMRVPQPGFRPEDTFEYVDDRTGEQLAWSGVELRENAEMYPGRPLRVRIRLEGEDTDAVAGAALARARELCRAAKAPARIYVSCSPEDAALVRSLADLGFRDDDGQVRMRRELSDPREKGHLPPGCVMVNDALELSEERRFFLERYNRLYAAHRDQAWLDAFTDRDDFLRIMAVASNGLVNETVVWREGETGVVGYIQTAHRWRRKGVATQMLSYAARYFMEIGLKEMTSVVHVRVPGLLRTFEGAGFRQEQLLLRYPGMDYDV